MLLSQPDAGPLRGKVVAAVLRAAAAAASALVAPAAAAAAATPTAAAHSFRRRGRTVPVYIARDTVNGLRSITD